jgi:hypothetical protein
MLAAFSLFQDFNQYVFIYIRLYTHEKTHIKVSQIERSC